MTTHTLHIGQQPPVAVNGIPGASFAYCERRDASGAGASTFPAGIILDPTGEVVGHISYNGRVWTNPPRDWHPDDKPIFCPSMG